MRSIKTYLDILRKKGFVGCWHEAKKAVWPLWWTRSRAAIEQIQAERASKYLWRYYKDLIMKPLDETSQADEPTRSIWVCWLQGREQAPEIVKRCLASMELLAPEYEIRLITAENMFDFVRLPEHIVQRYREGRIPFAHFSDILRVALLAEHGGVWLDATVLLTSSLPEQVSAEPFFMLQRSVLSSLPHAGSNWFLSARKGNPIMQRMVELLCAYWKHENGLRDYYIFHLFLYLLLTRNAEGQKMLKSMPYVQNVDAHVLQKCLFEAYDENVWKQMTSRSPIHKLTWKFNHNEPLDKKGTNYDYILHHLHI